MQSTCSDTQQNELYKKSRLLPEAREAPEELQALRRFFARLFASPLTFVLLVWGLMFFGLGIVLVYG